MELSEGFLGSRLTALRFSSRLRVLHAAPSTWAARLPVRPSGPRARGGRAQDGEAGPQGGPLMPTHRGGVLLIGRPAPQTRHLKRRKRRRKTGGGMVGRASCIWPNKYGSKLGAGAFALFQARSACSHTHTQTPRHTHTALTPPSPPGEDGPGQTRRHGFLLFSPFLSPSQEVRSNGSAARPAFISSSCPPWLGRGGGLGSAPRPLLRSPSGGWSVKPVTHLPLPHFFFFCSFHDVSVHAQRHSAPHGVGCHDGDTFCFSQPVPASAHLD